MTHDLDISRQRREGTGIQIIAFKPFDGGGTFRGWADVHVVGWHFRILGCPASSNNGSRWVGLPGKPMVDSDGVPMRDANGKVRYSTFGAFDDKDTLKRFSEAACLALDSYHPGWSERP